MFKVVRFCLPGLEYSHNHTTRCLLSPNNNPMRIVVASLRIQQLCERQQHRKFSYAVVHHGDAYEAAMAGQHGKQLELAKLEGLGKDDPPFDPFLEEELEEARLKAASSASSVNNGSRLVESEDGIVDDDDNDDDDGDDDDDDDVIDWRTIYNNDGSLKRSKAEKATLQAGAPAGGLFAVIELAGSQHKVTTDDVLIVNRLKPVSEYKIGSIHTLSDDNVMLIGSSHFTLVGMPYVTGAQVDIMVEEITKDAKVIVFSKRRRKNSKRTNGFRRDVTMLRILDIRPPDLYMNEYYHERPNPTPPPPKLEMSIATS